MSIVTYAVLNEKGEMAETIFPFPVSIFCAR